MGGSLTQDSQNPSFQGRVLSGLCEVVLIISG